MSLYFKFKLTEKINSSSMRQDNIAISVGSCLFCQNTKFTGGTEYVILYKHKNDLRKAFVFFEEHLELP